MNDKIKINLSIAGGNYPLEIEMNEEEVIRAAAKQINNRLNAYRAHYPNIDNEKVITMVAYEMSLENLKLKDKKDTAPYKERIEKLDKELKAFFSEE